MGQQIFFHWCKILTRILEGKFLDNDKDFAAKVLAVIKNNLFEIRKSILNLDDYVAKKNFDKLQQDYDAAQISLEEFKKENSRLESELADKSAKVKNLSKNISSLYERLEDIGKELRQVDKQNLALESSLEEILPLFYKQNEILQNYVENYSELEKVYNSYKKLSGNTKFGLEGIFGAENSPTSFLAGVLQEGHLESLFDYVATAINNGADAAEIEILRELFEFAFDATNSGRREKIYSRLNTQAGNSFDSDEMRKTSNSARAVKNVLLVGYKYSRTGKIVRQSLVFIG